MIHMIIRTIDNWTIDGILRQPFEADLHCSIHTSMLINVEESVVSFMNKDIKDISIGSVNLPASASNGYLSIPSIVQLSMIQVNCCIQSPSKNLIF